MAWASSLLEESLSNSLVDDDEGNVRKGSSSFILRVVLVR